MELSVVVPVHNEAGNVLPLLGEIDKALSGALPYEIVYVDDASDDATAAELEQGRHKYAALRYLRFAERCGQSAAVRAGVVAARGEVIVTLDGDGQNDPADIPKLLAKLRAEGDASELAMVAGYRQRRADSYLRRLSSSIANRVRRLLLHDDSLDSGCGLKAFSRDAFLGLPYFDHMHRFLPALMRREGYAVESFPVTHRPRRKGASKYGVGNRLWVGIIDLFGVAWLARRYKRPKIISEG